MAGPTGAGHALTTYRIPIGGSDGLLRGSEGEVSMTGDPLGNGDGGLLLGGRDSSAAGRIGVR